MTMCENYKLRQTHLLRLNSSGCLKYVIAPIPIMKNRYQLGGGGKPADQEEPLCLTCSIRCLNVVMIKMVERRNYFET